VIGMEKFPYGRTFILGFGFFGISIIWPLFNSLIPPMLEDLGLTAVMVGFILTWDNIINMVLQPYIGSLSDRTHNRFGRRKPFLMIGAPIAALFFVLVPYSRSNIWLIALRSQQGQRGHQLDGRPGWCCGSIWGWGTLQTWRPPPVYCRISRDATGHPGRFASS
jgi:hypothetical protein